MLRSTRILPPCLYSVPKCKDGQCQQHASVNNTKLEFARNSDALVNIFTAFLSAKIRLLTAYPLCAAMYTGVAPSFAAWPKYQVSQLTLLSKSATTKLDHECGVLGHAPHRKSIIFEYVTNSTNNSGIKNVCCLHGDQRF